MTTTHRRIGKETRRVPSCSLSLQSESYKYTLRDADEGDLEAIVAICADGWRDTYAGVIPQEFLDLRLYEYLQEKFREELGSYDIERSFFLIEKAGTVLGFAVLTINHHSENSNKNSNRLDSLYVAREARGTGVGTQLLLEAAEKVSSQATAPGISLAVLQGNVAAQRFYESKGARRVSRDDDFIARCGYVYGVYYYAWKDASILLETSRGSVSPQSDIARRESLH